MGTQARIARPRHVWLVVVIVFLLSFLADASRLVSADIVAEQSEVLRDALGELEKCKNQTKELKQKLTDEITRLRWIHEQDAKEKEQLSNLSLFELGYLKVERMYNYCHQRLHAWSKLSQSEMKNAILLRAEYYAYAVFIYSVEFAFGIIVLSMDAKSVGEIVIIREFKEYAPRDYHQYAEQVSDALFIGIPAFFLAVIWHKFTNFIQRTCLRVVFGKRDDENTKLKPPKRSTPGQEDDAYGSDLDESQDRDAIDVGIEEDSLDDELHLRLGRPNNSPERAVLNLDLETDGEDDGEGYGDNDS